MKRLRRVLLLVPLLLLSMLLSSSDAAGGTPTIAFGTVPIFGSPPTRNTVFFIPPTRPTLGIQPTFRPTYQPPTFKPSIAPTRSPTEKPTGPPTFQPTKKQATKSPTPPTVPNKGLVFRFVDPSSGDDKFNSGTQASPYQTLGRALEEAELGQPTAISLAPGTFYVDEEYRVSGTSLVITGSKDPLDPTIIDLGGGPTKEQANLTAAAGGPGLRLMHFASGAGNTTFLILQHLVIVGGRAFDVAQSEDEPAASFGGALLLSGQGLKKFDHVEFRDCSAMEGGALYFFGGAAGGLEFTSVRFVDNTAQVGGAVVLDLYGGSHAVFSKSVFHRNRVFPSPVQGLNQTNKLARFGRYHPNRLLKSYLL